MKKVLIITTLTAFLIVIANCSGNSGDEKANVSINNANGGNVNLTNSEMAANINTNMIPYPGTENTSGKPPLANADMKVVNVETKNLKPTNPTIPAADNSEIVTILNDKGAVETRTFKTNPLLSKIERTTLGKDVQLKVYLKNGKTISLQPDKIKNFTSDSAEQILVAAGIQPPPAPPTQNSGTGAATGAKSEPGTQTQIKPNNPGKTPNAPGVIRVPKNP